MAAFSSSISTVALTALFIFLLHFGGGYSKSNSEQFVDVDYLALAMNLEYLETDFFLCAAFGYDLSKSDDSELAGGGPPPTGCKKATFSLNWVADITQQFAYQEIGHLKAIKQVTKKSGFPRPQLDISAKLFANIIDAALSKKLNPPFNPYIGDLNFLIGAYIIPYVGLTAYVGSARNLQDPEIRRLVAGLLAVESGQDAVIRAILFQFKDVEVPPYRITVENFTSSISDLRNNLGNNGTKDEGIVVDPKQGAEGRVSGNVLAGDKNSVGYERSPGEVIRIIYGKKNLNFGAFFPKGAKGKIAESHYKNNGRNSNGDGSNSKVFVDVDHLTLAMNLEYLETDFFLCAAFGYDLSKSDSSELVGGGPPPRGCTKAKFYFPWVADITQQFAYQEIGHLKAIKKVTKKSGFARPQLDISAKLFANIINTALSKELIPSFDPYANDINFLIASYVIPYVGLTAYVGSAAKLKDPMIKKLVAGLLGVESGQDAVIRTLLFQFKDQNVYPYGITVEKFTSAISALRNSLGKNGTKDEGIVVDPEQGAEGKVAGNVLAGDENSVAYERDPDEVLRIIYGNNNMKFGGFFPNGAKGKIAESHYK